MEPTTAPKYDEVKVHHEKYNESAKKYADQRTVPYQHKLNVGDKVLLKRGKKTKFQSNYFPDVYKVKNVNGTMITVQKENGQSYKRHESFVKPFFVNETENEINFETDKTDNTPKRKQYSLRSKSS